MMMTVMPVMVVHLLIWGLVHPRMEVRRRTLVVGPGQGRPLVVLCLGFHSASASLSRSLAEPWKGFEGRV